MDDVSVDVVMLGIIEYKSRYGNTPYIYDWVERYKKLHNLKRTNQVKYAIKNHLI